MGGGAFYVHQVKKTRWYPPQNAPILLGAIQALGMSLNSGASVASAFIIAAHIQCTKPETCSSSQRAGCHRT